MPAAAVIPAPIAYVKIAAIKKLVVGCLAWCGRPVWLGREVSGRMRACLRLPFEGVCVVRAFACARPLGSPVTLKKLECSKQACSAVNTLAWNNRIGLGSYFVGF